MTANPLNIPSVNDARVMGAKGSQVPDEERLAFEAWMAGHCWALCAEWIDGHYKGPDESSSYVCPYAMRTRQLWAAWRDRAALSYTK